MDWCLVRSRDPGGRGRRLREKSLAVCRAMGPCACHTANQTETPTLGQGLDFLGFGSIWPAQPEAGAVGPGNTLHLYTEKKAIARSPGRSGHCAART